MPQLWRRGHALTKFVLLGYALVRFVDVLDAILERFTFWRQQLSDLIEAGSALTAQVVHQLADLIFVAAHNGLPVQRCRLSTAYPSIHIRI